MRIKEMRRKVIINKRVDTIIYSLWFEKQYNKLPVYIVDLRKLKENLQLFSLYFPFCSIYYAVKANSDSKILESLSEENIGFEIASVGELEHLHGLGIDPSWIICGNPCLDQYDIELLYSQGNRYFVFEHLEQLSRLVKIAPESRYVLRLNPYESEPSRIEYGASSQYVADTSYNHPELCKAIVGLTFYGDHTLGLMACEKAMNYLKNIEFVNIGGGFLHPKLEEELLEGKCHGEYQFFADMLKTFADKYRVKILMEPGAVFVKNVCHALAKVKYVNKSSHIPSYHIDLGPTLGLTKPVEFLDFLCEEDNNTFHTAYLVDSTCAKNLITKRKLPQLKEDDFVIFQNVGHYSIVYISRFHLLKEPTFLYIT